MLFIDTETTGLSAERRLVSVAWKWRTNKNLPDQDKMSYYVARPDGFVIPQESIDVHKITNEMAKKRGIACKEILDILYTEICSNESLVLVGYNIDFDWKTMMREAEIYEHKIYEPLKSAGRLDVMARTSQIFGISRKITLSAAHNMLLNSYFAAHDARNDVDATIRVYDALEQLGDSLSLTQKEYSLPDPSEEQQAILALTSTANVVVRAVAGSGKTTTILHLARAFPEWRILCLTYNANLKLETRAAVEALTLPNIEIHSFHSFAVKYIDHKAYTDIRLKRAVDKLANVSLPRAVTSLGSAEFCLPEYDMIIVDEAQDLREYFVAMIRNIRRKRTIIFGDPRQCIYEFNDAKVDYLLHPEQHFLAQNEVSVTNGGEDGWAESGLAQTFRLTGNMTRFVNECMLGTAELFTTREPGRKVRFVQQNMFSPDPRIIMELFDRYGPDEVMILTHTVRTTNDKHPLTRLIKRLMDRSLPIYVPIDDTIIEKDVMRGKVPILTYWQAKGLERRAVVVFGFDAYFYSIFKDYDPAQCPNPLYVAATRAREELVLIQGKNTLPFLHINNDIEEYTDIDSAIIGSSKTHCLSRRVNKELTVFQLISHLSVECIEQIITKLIIHQLVEPLEMFDVCTKTNSKSRIGIAETVEDIHNITIPALCFGEQNSVLTNEEILSAYASAVKELSKNIHSYRESQIDNYEWVDIPEIRMILARMKEFVPNQPRGISLDARLVPASRECNKIISIQHDNCKVTGKIDMIDANGNVWLFKFKSEIEPRDLIQLHLCSLLYPGVEYFIYNMRTCEVIKLDPYEAKDILSCLIRRKIGDIAEAVMPDKKIQCSCGDIINQCNVSIHNKSKAHIDKITNRAEYKICECGVMLKGNLSAHRRTAKHKMQMEFHAGK